MRLELIWWGGLDQHQQFPERGVEPWLQAGERGSRGGGVAGLGCARFGFVRGRLLESESDGFVCHQRRRRDVTGRP